MFATFVLERDPIRLDDLGLMVQSWVGIVGDYAALALALWVVVTVVKAVAYPSAGGRREDFSVGRWLAASVVAGILIALLPFGLTLLFSKLGLTETGPIQSSSQNASPGTLKEFFSRGNRYGLVYLGEAIALAAVLVPFLQGVVRLRFRRVWALARLSFKEAIRRKVLWGFSLLLLVFLFASWFLPFKPEDQVRNYVRAVFWAMTPIFLGVAGLLAAFSIPTDLKNQTMYTIVTKPVERFEIVLGRFLGYVMLMTLVLGVYSVLSLVYVARGISPEAAEESYKARVPVYGNLLVKGVKEGQEVEAGQSVGYEWEYRTYIAGGSEERAIWLFPRLPRDLAGRKEPVRCEFTFDIFRTTKGEENKGVLCSFLVQSWKCLETRRIHTPDELQAYRGDREKLVPYPELIEQSQQEQWPSEKFQAVLAEPLAAKYHFYELPAKEVVDFHTLSIDIPPALFKDLEEWEKLKPEERPAPLKIQVRCESNTQFLGVAKYDLYLLDAERPFWTNFLKGTVGLWFRICLVIGVAVACSTYLSGVISFLATVFLFMSGQLIEFVRTVAEGKTPGVSGPGEALFRLVQREHPSMPLEHSALVSVIQSGDKVFQWVLSRVLGIFPDVDRFSFTDYVAEGFDVSTLHLLLPTALVLVAYLLPWAILAYYLMKAREVAA